MTPYSTDSTIRTLDRSDVVAWCAALCRGFLLHRDPELMASHYREAVDLDRALAAYDGDRIVGTFRSFETELSLPGGQVLPADAITNVAVHGTHRRRGLLTGMMTRDLAAARERGEAVAILIASEWPIYGRYGFAPATEHVEYRLDALAASFLDDGEGSVDYADDKEARAVAPTVFDAHRLASPGEIARPARFWDVDFGVVTVPWFDRSKETVLLCRAADGTVTGYAKYETEDRWEARKPRVGVTVKELVAATPGAYARLWRFLCEMDWVTTVKAADRSVAEPLRWLLTDARALEQKERADFLWLRLLDVERALGARHYLTDGRVVLDVVDDLGHAGGRYELTGGPDGAQCRRTTADPDLALDVRALGSAYLGGVGLVELARAGRVAEARPGALARADAMFRSPVVPWCASWF